MSKKIIVPSLFCLTLLTANVWAASDIIQMTVINNSRMAVTFIDFSRDDAHQIKRGAPVSIDIKRPDAEDNLATLFFAYEDCALTGVAAFPLVRAPKGFLEFLSLAPEFIVTFYDNNGQAWAAISEGIDKPAQAKYLYHPVLNSWGFVEEAFGIVVFQDDKYGFDAWKALEETGKLAEWREPWEHLYPGEMTDWLRSPMESRGWIMPLDKIYNVSTWTHEELGSNQLVRLTPNWRQVTNEQLIVVKTFGDFGWGLTVFQDSVGKWYFMEYGYDGWGAYGDLWYVITDAPRRAFTGKDETLPWAKAFPAKHINDAMN